jgi:hypothetical protein
LLRPNKELKAFARVFLQPGEHQQLEFDIDEKALAFYDDRKHAWVVESGEFEILAGFSSADICTTASFEWQADSQGAPGFLPSAPLHIGLPLNMLLDDPKGKAVLRQHFGDILDHPMLEMAMGMTLEQIAGFAPDMLTPEILEQVDRELKKASTGV